jgi:hypothetical protein
LNGRFTALQQTASYIQIDTSQISASTKRLTDISAKSLVHLSSIDRKVTNLEALQNIKKGIDKINSGIDDMNLKGVHIR